MHVHAVSKVHSQAEKTCWAPEKGNFLHCLILELFSVTCKKVPAISVEFIHSNLANQ